MFVIIHESIIIFMSKLGNDQLSVWICVRHDFHFKSFRCGLICICMWCLRKVLNYIQTVGKSLVYSKMTKKNFRWKLFSLNEQLSHRQYSIQSLTTMINLSNRFVLLRHVIVGFFFEQWEVMNFFFSINWNTLFRSSATFRMICWIILHLKNWLRCYIHSAILIYT